MPAARLIRFKQALALAAFIALFFFDLPFPLIVLGAGALGIIAAAVRPDWFARKQTNSEDVLGPRPLRDTLGSATLWGAVWAAPLLLVLLLFGSDSVFWDIGVFFSQLAIVTFGGAYAVLAYMAQEAVQGFGWLQPGEMADGLGMAETTPGPLIMVTQFVGFLAAFRDPGSFSPIMAGLIGAGLTTWVTFAPCFLWIFSFAPWIDRLRNAVKLKGGLAALTAAVVGVIANLAVWFALHVLFVNVGETEAGPVRLYTPEWITFDWRAGVLAVLAALMIFAMRWGLVQTLAISAMGGLLLGLA